MASFCGFLVLLACFSSGFGEDNDKQPSCSKVKIAYRSKRLAESDVPVSAVDGGDLRVCPRNSGKQCCSARMEERFAVLATTDFNKAVSEEVGAIKALFNEQAKAFDGFVQQLIKKSQIELDTMFKKIYGSHYVMNTKLFMDLFVDFTYYYNGRNSDITNVMETFFASLMRRMFQIMNMQFQFSNSYLDCVSQHAKELKPFGDEPEKLIPQVKKSLVQARTFSQALHLGRDVVSTLGSAVSSSKECENQLIALKYCSWCKALTSLKPCHKFCTDVHRDCLANVVKVNPYWQEFLNTLSDLVARQTGPLNIQDVIGPINLKISFAIMNFQNKETQEEVRDKIFKGCGRPGGMSKRSTDDFFIEGTNNRQRRDDDPALIARSVSVQPNLDTLVTSYKKEMIEANNFWRNLPDAVCDGISKKDQNSGCWNGISNGSYTSPSDTDDPRTETNSVIQGAIDRLKEMVNQLKSAMEGEEVNMIPPVDESGDGSSDSGSGSGETSGDNNIISEYTVEPSSPQDNVIDDESEQEGGVGKPNARPKNSALQHVAELWLLSTTLFVLLSTL